MNHKKGKTEGEPTYTLIPNSKKLQLEHFNREENSSSFKSTNTIHLASSVHASEKNAP
jgi:hypothetical protein